MLGFVSDMYRGSMLSGALSVICLAVTLTWGGCGQERGALFPDLDPPVFWPAPPEPPRMKYVGQLAGEEDLKREVSFLEGVGQALLGKEDVGIFSGPYGLALAAPDRLYVADTSGGVIHLMDLETREYRQFSDLAGEKLISPIGVAVVGDNICVSDSALGRICVFDQEGEYQFSFGTDRLERPCGIAYGETNDRLYVADTKRHVISIFNGKGIHMKDLGSRGGGTGTFNFPTHVWVDRAGKLYVSDTLNYRIQVFDAAGAHLLTFGGHGDRPGYFAHPCGVASDSHGNIYVGDKQFENIQIFNSKGQILMALGGEGHGPGQFWLPAGIFIDASNRIFVADSFNKRIQVLQLLEAEMP